MFLYFLRLFSLFSYYLICHSESLLSSPNSIEIKIKEETRERRIDGNKKFLEFGSLTAIKPEEDRVWAKIEIKKLPITEKNLESLRSYFLLKNTQILILNQNKQEIAFLKVNHIYFNYIQPKTKDKGQDYEDVSSTEIKTTTYPIQEKEATQLTLEGEAVLHNKEFQLVVGNAIGVNIEDSPRGTKKVSYKQSYVSKTIIHPKDRKEMLFVPADLVVFGQDANSALKNFNPYFRDRNTANTVHIRAFYMDKYEVTNIEFFNFCQETGYPLPKKWEEGKVPFGEDEFPYDQASYYDAQAYARWAEKILPTELEWEMAARGGLNYWLKHGKGDENLSFPIYPIGNKFDSQLCNTREAGIGATLQIQQLKDMSPYGIVGMCGNAREWTSSWYAPYKGVKWANQKNMSQYKIFKVIRGGSFIESKEAARTDHRDYGGLPNLHSDKGAGFRLIMYAK